MTPTDDQLFQVYEKLWREKARKHMANMAITEVAKWIEMAQASKHQVDKDKHLGSAALVCELYINEMRFNKDY